MMPSIHSLSTFQPQVSPTGGAPPPAPPPPAPKSSYSTTAKLSSGPVHPLEQSDLIPTLEQALDGLSAKSLSQQSQKLPKISQLISPEQLKLGKQALVPVSQHAVLKLGAIDQTVYESAQTLTAKTPRSPFDQGRLPGPDGTLTIVAHGDGQSLGGKTPQELAIFLKAQGIVQLGKLDLTSCKSLSLLAEVRKALTDAGIQVGEVVGYGQAIAVDKSTGKILQQAQQIGLNDSGALGKLGKLFCSSPEEDEPEPLKFSKKPSDQGPQIIVEQTKTLPKQDSVVVPFPNFDKWANKLSLSKASLKEFVQPPIDQAMKKIPPDIKELFQSGLDEQSLLKKLCQHQWVQQTLADGVYHFDCKNNYDSYQENYDIKVFGYLGTCHQSSCVFNYLLNSLITHCGSSDQKKMIEHFTIDTSKNSGEIDHTWLKFKDSQDQICMLDCTTRQFQLTSQEGAIQSPALKLLSEQSLKLLKETEMIFIGTESEHDKRRKYIDQRN